MHAHRTITRLAAIATTAAVITPAASAQAATAHHLNSYDIRHGYTGPVAVAADASTARHPDPSTWKTIGPCTGAGPLARRPEFVEHRNPLRNRLSGEATCIGVIEY
jgi:hypothetical protein